MAELIKMQLCMQSEVGPGNHILDGVFIGATRWMRLNRLCAVTIQPCCQITLTSCYYYYQSPTNTTVHLMHC